MKNSKKISKIFRILTNPYVYHVLINLLEGEKSYNFFIKEYGKNIDWPLIHLLKCDLINKKLGVGKVPIGYTITKNGRWIVHSCTNFQKILVEAY